MVVSSGFLDHAAEVYLRANGLITSAQPINSTLNRSTEWSQQSLNRQPIEHPMQNSAVQQQQQQQQSQQQADVLSQTSPATTTSTVTSTTNSSVMQSPLNSKMNNNGQLPARVILICHSNSHPFQKRNILLEPRQEIKVGRSVPRSRVEESNAIFDCKVLSRNHAIIWYADGKFFIKDTGSSNGTFINSQRIKSSEAYEISSGDIVQFGVDVIENSRKETHGCIIAVLKLITPDGIEKTSYQQPISPGSGCSFDNDILRLKQIMHESYLREMLLEEKLVNLQKEVLATWKNSSNSWQAMIHEDLLLSRIDILENKLLCYQKNITNEKLQEQIVKLQDEKEMYQKTAKEALKKVYQDRLAVIQRFTKFEQFWKTSEDELMLLRQQLAEKENNDKLLQEVNNSNNDSIRVQMAKQEADCKAIKESFEAAKRETAELKTRLQLVDDFNESDLLITDADCFTGDKNRSSALWNKQQEIMHWLNNSDLKQLKESDDIINAICNDTKHMDILKVDPQKCLKLYEKLLDIEQRLNSSSVISATTTPPTELDNKRSSETITDQIIIEKCEESNGETGTDGNQNSENGESKAEIENESKENNANVDDIENDGNQNKQPIANANDDSESDVRCVIGELKEIYNQFLMQIKLLQNDLARASKYDELESKLIKTMLELQSLQKEQNRREALQSIQNIFNTDVQQLNSENSDADDGSTTAADDIIVLNGNNNQLNDSERIANTKAYSCMSLDDDGSEHTTDTLLRQKTVNDSDADDNFDTNSMSTIDETNNSSTNSIITEINCEIGHDDDTIEQSAEILAAATNSLETGFDRIELLNGEEGDGARSAKTLDKFNGNDDADLNADVTVTKKRVPNVGQSPPDDNMIGAVEPSSCIDDYTDEKEALDTFDRIIEEECKLITETDILREEELIELKERCVKLTDDNIGLRHEIESLRLNSNKQFTLLMYTAVIAAFIGYLFSIFFS